MKLSLFVLTALFFAFSAFSNEVVVVVENNPKDLPADVDPFLASTLNGFRHVQDSVKKTGTYDCNCKAGGVYTSFVLGNGVASEGGSLAWKAFSLRIGENITDNTRVDFIHINEGHPYNNHRDGFALQGTYKFQPTKKLSIETSMGPYFSMNTTEVKGVELDDKKLGLLTTIAALYSLDEISPGLHIRAEYNNAVMIGSPLKTNSIMVGIGKNFGAKQSNVSGKDEKLEVAYIGDVFITNHGDVDESPKGFQLEAKKALTDHTAGSLMYMKEGKDSRVDRQGVAAEYWYVEKLPKNVSVSVGAGPYIANNKRDAGDGKLNGIISIEVKKDLTKNVAVFFRVNRIADFKGSNDRDVIGLGIAGHL